jgi:hypothetical protein
VLDDERECGQPYGMAFAERYYYIDQRLTGFEKANDYVAKNAIPL